MERKREKYNKKNAIGQAERRAYNIISEAHQELESAIEDLRKLDPNNEELPTMEDDLKHME